MRANCTGPAVRRERRARIIRPEVAIHASRKQEGRAEVHLVYHCGGRACTHDAARRGIQQRDLRDRCSNREGVGGVGCAGERRDIRWGLPSEAT